MLIMIAALLPLSAALQRTPNQCAAYVGQTPATTTFADMAKRLPNVPLKSEYESPASYERRLADANYLDQQYVIRRSSNQARPWYDADHAELVVDSHDFGAREVDFKSIFQSTGDTRSYKIMDSDIGFLVDADVVARSKYAATNAFGAHFDVERVDRNVTAVWKSIGKLGGGEFVGAKGFGPIARLKLAPQVARDIIESGTTALLVVPRAPFLRTGSTVLAPSFSSPHERRDAITVAIADVRCAFLLDGGSRVVAAFAVK